MRLVIFTIEQNANKIDFNEFTILPIDFKNFMDIKFLEAVFELKGEFPTNLTIELYSMEKFEFDVHSKLLAYAWSVFLPDEIRVKSEYTSIDFLSECFKVMQWKNSKKKSSRLELMYWKINSKLIDQLLMLSDQLTSIKFTKWSISIVATKIKVKNQPSSKIRNIELNESMFYSPKDMDSDWHVLLFLKQILTECTLK